MQAESSNALLMVEIQEALIFVFIGVVCLVEVEVRMDESGMCGGKNKQCQC